MARHYEAAEGKKYYPPLVEYLSHQRATHFVLRGSLLPGSRDTDFATYLRQYVIGPSNPELTEEHHVRNYVVANEIQYKKEVDLPEDVMIDNYKTAFDNLIHCSDSTESALHEIANWYADDTTIVQRYCEQFEAL